jgi:hypothetical protein
MFNAQIGLVMETKINIVKILKDKPQGTKLYSSACGKCNLKEVDDKSFKISFYNSKFGFMNGGEGYLDKNGKLYDDGECVVFPSKEMRDWSKFAWKKGDVLINSCGFQCIFKEWASDDYTKFNGCYSNSKDGYEDVSNAETAKFVKLDNNIAYGYVREIERKLGGILNLETLEIEKTQPEFKDGDIVVYGESVAICRRFYKHTLSFYISLNEMFGLLFADEVESSEEYRFATEEEKQQLFDALEKEGKAWDAEKKQIVDIKKEHQFKPFEKVLVRDSYNDMWRASFFSHIKEDDGRYVTTGLTWKFCIPYIGNESLLGTTKDVEG